MANEGQAPVPQSGTREERGRRPEGSGSGREGRGAGPRKGGKRQFFRKRKFCKFCADKMDHIDYKDTRLLSQFVQERGKILPRRLTGTCSPHQHRLTDAIQRARNIALLPFGGVR